MQGSVFWTDGVYRSPTWNLAHSGAELAQADHFFAPESRPLIEPVPPLIRTRHSSEHDMELQMRTAKGRPIWVRFRVPPPGSGARPSEHIGAAGHLERKAVETAIRESEERWKLALESTGDGVWDWYIQTGTNSSRRVC